MTSGPIREIAFDPAREDGGVLCQLGDGRVFVTLADEIGKYAEGGDATALPAFNRAWHHDPGLFNGPIVPRMPRASQGRPSLLGSTAAGAFATGELPRLAASSETIETEHGFVGDLTEKDRNRMYAIIRKHHKFYFADEPTRAQMDNLIEGIGLRLVEEQIRKRVDAGELE
jgi:hypothetical protein